MSDNIKNVNKATSSVRTETPVGKEHLTIQDYIEMGRNVLGWERLGSITFVLYLA